MMAPWDSKMRWQFGGNLQRVRLICELNWRECPLAIVNHIWSEIVTDVVDCVTNEGILLRLIILILVFTILFHTIWTRTQWITGSLVSKDSLNRVDFKVQDLELRVNVLTYKMQYGAWPSPQQINNANIKELKDDVRLSLGGSGSHRYSWWDRCLDNGNFKDRHISRSENLGLRLHKPETLIETSDKIYYNRSREMRDLQLFEDALDIRNRFEKCDKMIKKPKKNLGALKNDEKCHMAQGVRDSTKGSRPKSIIKKRGEKRRKSMSENSLRKSKRAYLPLKSIHDYVPATTTAESSCDDSANPLSTSPNMNTKLTSNSTPFMMKTLSTMNSSASFKRLNTTQETLANVKERLENLHIILKTYGSHHELESTQKGAVEELANASLQNSDELCTATEKNDEKSSNDIPLEPSEIQHVHNQKSNIETFCNSSDECKQINEIKDEESDFEVRKIDDEMKSPTLIDTDEDLGSFSSAPEPSKVGSDSDKSTQSSDALMLNALLNQLDLTNLRRWNNKSSPGTEEDENEYETENMFPKMKSFYQSKLLDIISEEQSGSSCTERASKTIVHSKIVSTKNDSISEFPNEYPSENSNNTTKNCESIELNIIDNPHVALEHSAIDDKNNNEKPEMCEGTEDNMNNYTIDNIKNTSELSNISPQTESQTYSVLNNIRSIRPWEKLLEYSSEESIGNCVPHYENFHWNTAAENISKTDDIIKLDYVFDTQNGEQLLDGTNLSLERRPGVFSMAKSTAISEYDNQLTQNPDNDLIDLNYDDSDEVSKNERENPSHEIDVSMISIDANDILNAGDIDCPSETLPLTDRTVISTKKIEDNINSHATDDNGIGINNENNISPESLCKNSKSRNLIELERITYEELTQVENSWDSEWISNNSCEEISISDTETRKEENKKIQSHNKKSSLNILSSPSSLYLTVQGSFSDMSIDSNQCMETIEKIEMPDEVKNIENVEATPVYCDYTNKSTDEIIIKSKKGRDNEDEECTVISKDSALSETPQQSIIVEDNTDTNGKFMNADDSSMNSSTGTSPYADAGSHNLTHSSGVSSSFDPPESSQSSNGKTVHLSALENEGVNQMTIDALKTAKGKFIARRVDSKNSKTTKSRDKKKNLSAKAKSNSNLPAVTSLNLRTQKTDNRTDEFTQRRTKSHIIPRKRDTAQVCQDLNIVQPHNSITKFGDTETKEINSKNHLMNRLSNSRMKVDRANSFSKSRESVNKSASKSCIPLLKTRFDASKNLDSRSKSQLRAPPAMSADIGHDLKEIGRIEKTLCVDKNDRSENRAMDCHETIDSVNDKHSVIVPEKQTVIYVNIVTDHDNCVTKVVDPKKFLEYVKDKDLNIQEIVNDNCSHNQDENGGKECTNSKFITVISSTEKNPLALHQQREMEVLAKPSVIDMSTSISDIPKDYDQPKELTTDEYMTLLETLEQPTNFHEYQKIHQACSELESDAQE